MSVSPRVHLSDLRSVHHGSISDAELGALRLRREDVLDFSVNANPLGPSPAALEVARGTDWAHYPDDAATQLRCALARRDGVAEDRVVVGNGSAELIWLAALAFLEPGDAVVVVGPTFGEYARAARVMGAIVHEYRAAPASDFAVDLNAVADLAKTIRARMVFLCNPNNPTGVLLPLTSIAELADDAPVTLIVVDEAYRQFVDAPPPSTTLLPHENILLLRSLTKDYALTGLRLGYAIASEATRAALDKVRPPWSVNAVAQAAGVAALHDEAHLERARAEVRRSRIYLSSALTALGLRVLPSAANYLLVEVGDARHVRAALLQHGICVRDCTSFGLPEYVRIGLRTLSDSERLVAAFSAIGCRLS